MRGEYSTRQRRDVLKYLTDNAMRHYTLDELSQALREDGITAGKTTVYRFLEQLSEQGRVRKYQNETGFLYQYVQDDAGCDAHLHLMCRACGELFHVDCELVGMLARHIRGEHNFVIDPRQSVLVGICGACAARAGEDADGAHRT